MEKRIIDSISESVLCWLATVNSEGMPNVSPKEVFSQFDSEFIIANIASPQSAANMRATGKASVSFINVFTQKGFKLKGRAKEIAPGEPEYDARHQVLYELAGDRFPIQSILSISVEEIHEIIAPSYYLFPDTTEESQKNEAYRSYKVKPSP